MMKQLCFQIFGMSGRCFSEFWPRYEANSTRVLQFLLYFVLDTSKTGTIYAVQPLCLAAMYLNPYKLVNV
jgi:hypothetical protein